MVIPVSTDDVFSHKNNLVISSVVWLEIKILPFYIWLSQYYSALFPYLHRWLTQWQDLEHSLLQFSWRPWQIWRADTNQSWAAWGSSRAPRTMASGWPPNWGSWRWRICSPWPGSLGSVQTRSRWPSACSIDSSLWWRLVNTQMRRI